MRVSLFILAVIAICSCGQRNESIQSISLTDTSLYYLPLEKFTDTSSYVGQDTFLVTWYSGMLKALKEPILFNKSVKKEIYRLTWLRTFHNPVAIRIEKSEGGYTLFWKLCDGAGGYEPGQLIINKSKKITQEDWDDFQDLLQEIDFWNIETEEKGLEGNDGSQWILEGLGQKGYHVVDRWTPQQNGYYNCGNFLIEMTDLEIPADDKY